MQKDTEKTASSAINSFFHFFFLNNIKVPYQTEVSISFQR